MKIGIISGASSGIGYEIAKLLDESKLDEIWLVARNKQRLDELSKALKTKSRAFMLDLTNNDSFDILKSNFQKENAQIDYLVASAGVGYAGEVINNTNEQIANMIDLNVRALALFTRCALPYMSNGGKIIEIASGAGFLPQPEFAVYAATKAFVISFSRALNKELKKRKISVTAVCPGPVDTPFFSSLENVKEYKKKHLVSPYKVAKGAIKASKKGKSIYSPTFSIKLVHLISKILPTSLILKFM